MVAIGKGDYPSASVSILTVAQANHLPGLLQVLLGTVEFSVQPPCSFPLVNAALQH